MPGFVKKSLGAVVFVGAVILASFFLQSGSGKHNEFTAASVTEASLYEGQVQPIFTARCIACHSCNTAPCQLNLTNYDGAVRGANKTPMNQPFKQSPSHPTRLGIDAQSEDGWRALGFFSVVNHDSQTPSILERALALKAANPKVEVGTKAESAKNCPMKEDEWKKFNKAHSDMGMPFGLPALSGRELSVIATWLKAGAPGPDASEARRATEPPTPAGRAIIAKVESFLNGPSISSKIVARYLYEHLYLAHLHFQNEMPNEFYRLTRSRTTCDRGVDEIASPRPYDDPGTSTFSYCIRKLDQAVTEKNHIVYEMGAAKLARWQQLFFGKRWTATALPSYAMESSANPFVTFKDLPAEARYRWLLDDSQYTVMTFIKGAVCRGHTAVNVIDEQFHVLFLDPKADHFVNDPAYAESVSASLKLPGHYGSNVKFLKLSTKIVPILMSELKNRRNDYRAMHDRKYEHDRPRGYALDDIWDGDGTNPNAVLTIYRHFDSAQVLKGTWGPLPKTSWVLDYPLFERIVYDLVAGYDNYGSMGHQVLTRVYMHFLRMEAEENFLNFLPAESRVPLRAYWYRDAPDVNKRYPLNPGTGRLSPTSIAYTPHAGEQNLAYWNQAKTEFFNQVFENRLSTKARGPEDLINSGQASGPIAEKIDSPAAFEKEMRKLMSRSANLMPFSNYLDDTALLRLKVDGGAGDRVYTLVRNKEHFNIASLLGERGRREYVNDSLNVLPGFQASYPNRFFVVELARSSQFLKELGAIHTQAGIRDLITHYGVARLDPQFWNHYDWFVKKFAHDAPTEAGAIDLNRYGNAEPLPEDDENAEPQEH